MLHEIAEQDAIFDGKPHFTPSGMLINLLNYYSFGGSKRDFENIKHSGELENPKRYKVSIRIEYEEINDNT